MRACPTCGAAVPPDAGWCGQCFVSLSAPAPAFGNPQPALAGAAAPVPAYSRASVPTPVPDGRMAGGRALGLTALAVGIGAIGMVVSWWLSRDDSLQPETYIRYAIVLTLGVYAVVGALIVTRLVPGTRLRWHTGNPAAGVLFGAVVGGGLSGMLLAVVSAASGHLAPDPRIVTIMSEGDVPHLAVGVLIGCACAPLVEEVLFRGILLESLRGRGRVVAVAVSGVAFAVWHLNPGALRYYALMGVLLGGLYLRRGLVCSMAAHLAFNGVLTVAALAVVLGPTTTISLGPLSLRAPGGWSAGPRVGDQLVLGGPSGSSLLLADEHMTDAPSPATLTRRIQTGALAGAFPFMTVDPATTRQVPLTAGRAVEVSVRMNAENGTLVALPLARETVVIIFFDGGSAKARADFDRILNTVRVG